MVLKVSHSSLTNFLTCPRKFDLARYWETKEYNLKAQMGTLAHDIFRYYLVNNMDVDKTMRYLSKVLFKEIENHPEVFKVKEDAHYLFGTIEGWLRGCPYWKEIKDIIATEEEFEIPFDDEIVFTGRIDGKIKTNLGLFIQDFKTTGDMSKICHPKQIKTNFQATFYYYAAKAQGFNPVGVIFTVFKRPALRLRKNETPEDYEERITEDIIARPDFYFAQEISFRDKNPEMFNQMMDLILADIKRASKMGYRMNPTACNLYSPCPYIPICYNDPDWERLYNRRDK